MSSPFHCKGLVYLGAKTFYEKRIPGGTKQMLSWIDRPDTLAFWNQHFLSGSFYDIIPIVDLSRAAARAAGIPHYTLVRENAKSVAERDIHGVYRMLLKLASPELVVKRLPRAALQYFNFGITSETRLEGKHFYAKQDDIPEVLGKWMSACIEGFAPVALAAAGAAEAKARVTSSAVNGARDGHNLVSLEINMEWH